MEQQKAGFSTASIGDEQLKKTAKTQELADASLKVIDLLEKMPGATPTKP